MNISSYRDLRVWQAGMSLVDEIRWATSAFPSEPLDLVAVMQRASIAIPTRIADGHTRASTPEYLECVAKAHGALAQLQTQVDIAARFGYLTPQGAADLRERTEGLSKALSALRKALTTRMNQPARSSVSNDVQ